MITARTILASALALCCALTLGIAPRPAAAAHLVLADSCNPHAAAIAKAFTDALPYAQRASAFPLQNQSDFERGLYERWFGELDQDWGGTVSEVIANFEKIRAFLAGNQDLQVLCPAAEGPTLIARVNRTLQGNNLQLFPAFFRETRHDTGYESRAITIVHEMSHYVTDDISDYCNYDSVCARRWAVDDPWYAKKDAFNYECFALEYVEERNAC